MSAVDDIVQTCGDQPVCLYDGASISNATELQGVLPQGVQVIVIPPPDQAQSVPTSSIAQGVQSVTGSHTVIVIEDRATDRFVVASDQDAAAIAESLYTQREADGGVAVAAVASSLDVSTSPGNDAGADGGNSLGGGALVGIIALVVVAGAIVEIVHRVRKRSRNRAALANDSAHQLQKELREALDGEDGQFVQEAIGRLQERAAALPNLAPLIMGLHQHVSELFVRVRRRGTDQQVRLLQSQYKDTLAKLLKALDDDYYGDIRVNPRFWSNPEARLAEVELAVGSVDQQAVENIRQVNESRDLEFQVALDSLIKTVDEAKLSDVYSEREK